MLIDIDSSCHYCWLNNYFHAQAVRTVVKQTIDTYRWAGTCCHAQQKDPCNNTFQEQLVNVQHCWRSFITQRSALSDITDTINNALDIQYKAIRDNNQ